MGTTVVALTFSTVATMDANPVVVLEVRVVAAAPLAGVSSHYHQATDELRTINHDLVAEVARTTTATVMALAAHPSRPRGLAWQRAPDGVTRVRWDLVPERDAVRYRVRYRAVEMDEWMEETTTATRVDLPALPDGADVQVKAVSRDGLEGWDWARIVVGEVPAGG